MIELRQCYIGYSKIFPLDRMYEHQMTREDVPVRIWLNEDDPVEENVRQQLLDVAKLPFILSHVAAMPDVHYGKGITIGGVVPCFDVVVPFFVGVN